MKNKSINIRISEEEKKIIEAEAEKRNLSVSQFMLDAAITMAQNPDKGMPDVSALNEKYFYRQFNRLMKLHKEFILKTRIKQSEQ